MTMPRFCANLSMLFTDLPFIERFAAAAKAGFKAVEFLSPYETPVDEVVNSLTKNGLTQALFNVPSGNWSAGERGIACIPGREIEFREGVDRAILYAKATRCKTINVLAGIKPHDVAPEKAFMTLVDNLIYAVSKFSKEGILLVVEPINSFDIPGFFLNRSADGLAVIDAVKDDNLKLQYDIYHMQRMEGEVAATLERLLPLIGHVQIADNPGRNEPGTGELNYRFLFEHLDRIGYRGWVGCEYKPRGGTEEGLNWINELI
jgi:hydroxypyruvate isomerase